jgi:hypothetical protein
MVNAFAKALWLSPQELVDKLRHDGLGTFPGTSIQRTHHVQEILDAASDMNVWFTPVELVPQSFDPATKTAFPIYFGDDMADNFARFRAYLKTSKGVIQGMRGRTGHAVYWDGQCHDNRGSWSLWAEGNDFLPSVYWRMVWTT